MKNIIICLSEKFHILVVKFSIYLNRRFFRNGSDLANAQADPSPRLAHVIRWRYMCHNMSVRRKLKSVCACATSDQFSLLNEQIDMNLRWTCSRTSMARTSLGPRTFVWDIPAGTQHQNDVVSTSMRRDYVASTLIRRHFNVVFLLGWMVRAIEG